MVVLGGGPGGYEAALVAARLGATVTIVDRDGLGGACVLTDCVPSKSIISTAHVLRRLGAIREHGIDLHTERLSTDLHEVNERILGLAQAQSEDIEHRLRADPPPVCRGTGRLLAPGTVRVDGAGTSEDIEADIVLVVESAV